MRSRATGGENMTELRCLRPLPACSAPSRRWVSVSVSVSAGNRHSQLKRADVGRAASCCVRKSHTRVASPHFSSGLMETPGSDCAAFGYDVVLTDGGAQAPCCPHGPTLLFEKVGKGSKSGRRFFACSACRDRKDCSFFQWEDDKVSETRRLAREERNTCSTSPFSHQQHSTRLRRFSSLPPDSRKFCQDCQLLLLPGELADHDSHASTAVSGEQLRRPTTLLSPLHNKKNNAQYLFSKRTSLFLLDTLAALGFSKVLCVGAPRIHELIKLRNLEKKNESMRSLLLDIDFRYAQFYNQDEFCHYNMFNHHFFGGEASSAVLQAFLTEAGGEKVVMVADPPFGGLVKPLANNFSLISQTWRKLQSSDRGDVDMAMVWIFPHFFEPRIKDHLSSLTMLDYQVDYDNHPQYKHGKTGRKQTPVRLFTNISPRDFVLPKEEGYRLCSICERYVGTMNKHCTKCNTCPSKDGRQWKHCSACSKCVKPSWRHCQTCGRCALPDHPCDQNQGKTGCFNCGSLEHKRKGCPAHTGRRPNSAAKRGGKMAHLHSQVKGKAKRKSGAARRAKKAAAAVSA